MIKRMIKFKASDKKYPEDKHRENQDYIIMAWKVFLVGNTGFNENTKRHLIDSLVAYKENHKDKKPLNPYKFDHV